METQGKGSIITCLTAEGTQVLEGSTPTLQTPPLFYSLLPDSFPTPSTPPNILQLQPLLGCFLVLCWVPAGRSVGRPYSQSRAAVDAIPRGVLLSEAVTRGFSSAATKAFECMYTYTDNNFRILSPTDYSLSFRPVTNSLCLIPRQYSNLNLSFEAQSN